MRIESRLVSFLFLLLLSFSELISAADGFDSLEMTDHVPVKAIERAKLLARVSNSQRIRLTVSLPLRNQKGLDVFLHRVYDPGDTLYGKFLSSNEFIDRFAPLESDYEKVAGHLVSQGLIISRRHNNRLLLDVEGTPEKIERTFRLKLHRYRSLSGRFFFGPDKNPELPRDIGSRILHIDGFDNARLWRNHVLKKPQASTLGFIGKGPAGGISPDEIAKAYNFNFKNTKDYSPASIGVLELGAYSMSDVSTYQKYFGLSDISVDVVKLGGKTHSVHQLNNLEATLDVELLMATVPPGSTIKVYEGVNTGAGFLDILNRIVSDNQVKVISCSWGSSENSSSSSYLMAENQIFQQMAAQGQSFFAAAGDSGAFDDGVSLSVDDPASQPFVIGVGGTKLILDHAGNYLGETTWNNGSPDYGAGGGGVSKMWKIPDFQVGLPNAASQTKRNVPDVALNSDPNTGYSIFYNGVWQTMGGTSCAAPIWAGFAAHINLERKNKGLSELGFLNPMLYRFARSTDYSSYFNDINDNSNNLYYKSRAGFDNATGWGSFNGSNLLADMASDVIPTSTDPLVWMISPQGGEYLSRKSYYVVKWDSFNISPKKHLRLFFSRNNGRSWNSIGGSLPVKGSLRWKPGLARVSNRALMKVCLPSSGKLAAICSITSGTFTITKH